MDDHDFRGSDVHGGEDVDQSMVHNTSHVNSSESASEKGGITPVNIRQLIHAEMPETNHFVIDCKTKKKRIEQVTLVAQIVKFTNEPEKRKLNLFLDDGTGRMSVILYAIDTEKKFEACGGVIENGLFLRIYGILNIDNRTGTRYIVGTGLSLIMDINEFTTHLLDVIVASLHSQYGSLVGKKVPKVQQQKTLEVSIYELVAKKPGISFHEVVSELNSDFDATIAAFQILFEGGNLGYAPNSTEQYVVANKLFY
ncbi:hypothetical protein NAEGRDRAFT_81289 [Naegleria gruberi]|uniref:Uncharacterized protein n=1 Tax=Naegleria gruberi TaxID=5762 RepID=D2VUQ1_NAEGR|nr:uncharacterized protein NAEGRDRAFT_81289 [Naegleria gruberi]EFC39546.1 hypothetical protein NAEGRDRAFT_81289 [Naegleria gruberi]|eukprot:XP_002672290.1 hypothetical protein NAEGRDRAFT_81289 [Naegleria gruberi strain NEG-M]